MPNFYDIVQGQGNLRRKDIPIKATAADADMKAGRWVYKDATGYAVKTPASPALSDYTVNRPGWSGKEKPDAVETNQVTTVFGAHEVLSDGFNANPPGLAPARAAWSVGLGVVTIDGELVPYLAGTDNEEAILGTVEELADSTGRMRFHIK